LTVIACAATGTSMSASAAALIIPRIAAPF
jgi:hypothetical protein